MVTNNSLALYKALTVAVFEDIVCAVPDSRSRMCRNVLLQRIDKEGLSFLTKTLPALGKAIDYALSTGSTLSVTGFRLRPGSRVPHFCGWLIERVFKSDGSIRSDADVLALKHLRQLVYLLYKLDIPYEPKTTQAVIDSFIQTEKEIGEYAIPPSVEPIIKYARTLCTRVFCDYDPRDIIPRHGPGSVATGERGLKKAYFSRIIEQLEPMYPFTEYFRFSLSHVSDTWMNYESLESVKSGTAKVVLVPKDSRGPRLISCEPIENQWIQQGIMGSLVPWIERDPLMGGHVNFRDQSINRNLALSSSRYDDFVTLDLKDASDRVSLEIVERLFSGTALWEALWRTRSTATRLPDGSVIELKKFAPMGSALCFPVESSVFFLMAVAAIVCDHGVSLARARDSVFVYGDDLIVRREFYPVVIQRLESIGLLFNKNKCCTSRFFRESCGCDAYRGVDVTPIKVRLGWDHSLKSPGQLASWADLSNRLYMSGYWRAADIILDEVERLYGLLPYLESYLPFDEYQNSSTLLRSRVIGIYRSHVNPITENRKRKVKMRFNPNLHRVEVFGYVVTPFLIKNRNDGWEELLRRFTCGSDYKPGYYALVRRSCLKRTWGSIS